MKNIFIRSLSAMGLIAAALFFSSPLAAAEGVSPFEKLISYNIYLAGSDGEIVVFEAVEITGFDELMGKTFLVFKSKL